MEKHERLRAARLKAGFKSAKAAADALGVKPSTYTSHENDTREFYDEDAVFYAWRFKVSAEWLIFGTDDDHPAPQPDKMPVRGEVRGGAWLEIDGDPEVEEYLPITPDSSWRVPQYALKVVGNSMNKVAAPGIYVIVASWPELGTDVQENDLLVVRRNRAMTYEVTLKRAKQGMSGWELWPESTDPRWQEPIQYHEDAPQDGNDIEVMILGKVIGKYERLA